MRMNIKMLCLLTLVSSTALASSESVWQSADALIPGYQKPLNAFNAKADCRLVLPKKLLSPKSGRYYLYLEHNASGKVAYIDYSADCHGAHYCNAGSLSVKRVAQSTDASFRFHGPRVGADYHSPQLAWSKGYCEFTLIWDTNKSNLLSMARSIKKT